MVVKKIEAAKEIAERIKTDKKFESFIGNCVKSFMSGKYGFEPAASVLSNNKNLRFGVGLVTGTYRFKEHDEILIGYDHADKTITVVYNKNE